MVEAINGQFNHFPVKPINEREAKPIFSGENFFVNPGAELTGITNGLEISIPKIHSYTTDIDGTKVAMGQDGVGLAHRNPSEYGLHLIG